MKEWLQDIWHDLEHIHKSLTIWFNSVVGVVALYLPEMLAFMPQLREYVTEPSYKQWMLVLLVGNALLRFKTTTAMRNK